MSRLVSGYIVALALAACSTTEAADIARATEPAAPNEQERPGSAPPADTEADAGADVAPPGRLPDAPLPSFSHATGSGLKAGVVTGRIYDDLAKNVDERMRDLGALGIHALRLEIEQTAPLTDYAKIVRAAKANGIEVLALFTQNSMTGPKDPMAGSRADFDATFVPAFISAIDTVTAAIPELRYVEVWNEPDVYAFSPLFSYSGGTCTRLEGAHRYALLTVRVFETMHERRKKNVATPTLVAFDFSHQDDTCVIDSVIDTQPIASHRAGYRVPNALADGLPTDIVSIHGYGLANKIPGEPGYTYAGGTFADGVQTFVDHTFADGRSMLGAAPVWYTEVGFCLGSVGTLARQSTAVTRAFDTLRSHPRITAAFVYSYRDDEGTGGERCGLRDNSANAFAPHPSYRALQEQSVKGGDVVAPAGTFAASVKSSTEIQVTGSASDADGKPPVVEIAIDGVVVQTLTAGGSGFTAVIAAPTSKGSHEIAARAKDAAGNARVIGRTIVTR